MIETHRADEIAELRVLIVAGAKPTITSSMEVTEEWLAKTDAELLAEAQGRYRAPDVPSADSPEAMRAQAAVEARFPSARRG